MKKKVIALIVVLVMLVSISLTGCTFIKVNNERKANEIMATVSIEHGGQNLSLTVSRNELVSYVNYIINMYSQYGMSYDPAVLIEQGLDALINQKYLVLQGMVYLSGIDARKAVMYANTDEYKAIYGTKLTPEGVLTVSERLDSIATTNESFVTNIETYVDEYNTEKRDLAVANAKEDLTSYHNDGYTVKEDGVAIYHEKDGEYVEGLYQTSFIADAATSSDSESAEPETDNTKIVLKIVLEKSGAEDVEVYLPVSESAVTTEVDSDADFISNYVTTKICKVTYDEPVTDEDGEVNYDKHTAEATFTLVTPRTAYVGEEEDTEEDLTNGDVPYRYSALADFTSATDGDLFDIYKDGQIFVHTKETYADDAEKDAYRQFRESKKSMAIGFTAEKDTYNGLGYYYLSAFESAVLSAVQHELTKAALTETPITSEQVNEQYKVLVEKQKEEYSVLSAAEQVKKFATTVKSDLTGAYYVPIEALKSESFEYDGNTYNYAKENADGTVTINMFYIGHVLFKWTPEVSDAMNKYIVDRDEDETKEIKTQFLEFLKTNKSQLTFANAEEKGTLLKDAFFVNEDDGTIAEFSVLDVLVEMRENMATSTDPLKTFQEYMTYFNDDSGSMTSKLGYFVPMGEIDHGYDGDDFPNMAIDLYLKNLAAGVDPDQSNEISEIAFTSYGMHVEYITFAPFYNLTLDANSGLGAQFALNLDGDTFEDTIKKNLEDEVSGDVYSKWSKEYDSDEALEHATKDNKKLKNLLKDLGL